MVKSHNFLVGRTTNLRKGLQSVTKSSNSYTSNMAFNTTKADIGSYNAFTYNSPSTPNPQAPVWPYVLVGYSDPYYTERTP